MKMKKNVVILLFGTILLSGLKLSAQSVVKTGENVAVTDTEPGKFRGYIHNGINTDKGIPYAQAEWFVPLPKPSPDSNPSSHILMGH